GIDTRDRNSAERRVYEGGLDGIDMLVIGPNDPVEPVVERLSQQLQLVGEDLGVGGLSAKDQGNRQSINVPQRGLRSLGVAENIAQLQIAVQIQGRDVFDKIIFLTLLPQSVQLDLPEVGRPAKVIGSDNGCIEVGSETRRNHVVDLTGGAVVID